MSEQASSMTQPGKAGSLVRLLGRIDDGQLMRWAFRGLLVGAIFVVGLDVKALYDKGAALDDMATGGTVYLEPALPPALRPGVETTTVDPRETMTLDAEALRLPMRFELRGNGVLAAEGSIDPGAARRLLEELDARGEYVKTVTLNSPGGSLDDAMSMAKMVRERGLATSVEDGAICASSCPLMLAGGVSRMVAEKAAVGLHQFYAGSDLPTAPAQAMSDAQKTAARIARYLTEMDVDPALWLHALDTPPQSLYYLSRDEMERYRLVTIPG